MSRFAHIVSKEFLQIRRDPMTVRLVVMAPLMQLLLIGYAANTDVRNVRVAVFDGDRSADSRLLVEEIDRSYTFNVVGSVDDPRRLETLILTGRAQIGLHIPRDLHRSLMRGEEAQVGLLVDGSDSTTSGVAAAYMQGIIGSRALRFQLRAARAAGALGATAPGLTPEPRVWYNVDLSSVNYMVPGVFGLVLMVLTVTLSALSIVRERENGTLEQLMVTPLRPRELLFGKVTPFAALILLDAAMVFLLARGWFHVPFRGSLLILFGTAILFLLSTLGLGILISATSRTQQEAQIVAFLMLMPSVLLSGFAFPISNMPAAIQYLTYLIPLRYFLVIVRGLFLRGVGLEVLWPQVLAMAVFGVVIFALGLAVFRKHL